MKAYLHSEIARAAQPIHQSHIVVVLSAPVFFNHSEKAQPERIPPDARRRVVYLRYWPYVPKLASELANAGPDVLLRNSADRRPTQLPVDDLEKMLRPLNASVREIHNSADTRKALAFVMEEIGRAGVALQ